MSGRLSSAGPEILAFGSHCSANFQPISDCFVPNIKLKYKDSENIKADGVNVPTHVVTPTQVGTSVYLGQTHLGTPFQVPAWVRKFSLGSTGDEIYSLIIIEGLFVQQKFEY